MALLDMRKWALYTARPLTCVLALGAAAANAEMVNGAQIPDGAQKVGENRYRAPQSFDETVTYYKSVYGVGAYPRRLIVNQPGVKAVHISNPSGKNFEGLNIYEANEEVRIYIVPTASVAAAAKKKTPDVKAPKAAPKKPKRR